MSTSFMDDDAMVAAVDVIGRTGAREFKVGFVNDEPPHNWYAHAQYQGTRITVENKAGPLEAAEGLARRLLTGAQCQHCLKLVTLDPHGAIARDQIMVDGRTWTARQQAEAGLCHWYRAGNRWKRGCE
jgi:hypothetical protein